MTIRNTRAHALFLTSSQDILAMLESAVFTNLDINLGAPSSLFSYYRWQVVLKVTLALSLTPPPKVFILFHSLPCWYLLTCSPNLLSTWVFLSAKHFFLPCSHTTQVTDCLMTHPSSDSLRKLFILSHSLPCWDPLTCSPNLISTWVFLSSLFSYYRWQVALWHLPHYLWLLQRCFHSCICRHEAYQGIFCPTGNKGCTRKKNKCLKNVENAFHTDVTGTLHRNYKIQHVDITWILHGHFGYTRILHA